MRYLHSNWSYIDRTTLDTSQTITLLFSMKCYIDAIIVRIVYGWRAFCVYQVCEDICMCSYNAMVIICTVKVRLHSGICKGPTLQGLQILFFQ